MEKIACIIISIALLLFGVFKIVLAQDPIGFDGVVGVVFFIFSVYLFSVSMKIAPSYKGRAFDLWTSFCFGLVGTVFIVKPLLLLEEIQSGLNGFRVTELIGVVFLIIGICFLLKRVWRGGGKS